MKVLNRVWARSALLICFGLFASATLLAQAPAAQPATPAATAPAVTPPQSVVGADYIIGPGDTLQIYVWRNPELTVTLPVRPDGRISAPLVEDMVAVGKTPSALARDIEKVLSEFVRTPQVNVIVTSPAGLLSQVKAVGQVESPQAVPYRAGMRVLDLVLAAGGLTDYAAGNRAKLVRQENGKTIDMKVKLDRLVNKGDMEQNLLLKPGDVLVVPETRL
jgi:polysaccharide export outer membrane protein